MWLHSGFVIFFGARKLTQKLLVKCWWNWLQEQNTLSVAHSLQLQIASGCNQSSRKKIRENKICKFLKFLCHLLHSFVSIQLWESLCKVLKIFYFKVSFWNISLFSLSIKQSVVNHPTRKTKKLWTNKSESESFFTVIKWKDLFVCLIIQVTLIVIILCVVVSVLTVHNNCKSCKQNF